MPEWFWPLVVGVAAGFVPSLVLVLWQRRWQVRDRRDASAVRDLDAAVSKVMAWQDMARKVLSHGDTAAAERRLLELDTEWHADTSLIPDQEATKRLLSLSQDIWRTQGGTRDGSIMEMNELTDLMDRVLRSAQQKRRDLA